MTCLNYSSLNKLIDAAIEPVTRPEVKEYLRIDHSDDDNLINDLIKSARITIENHLNRSLIKTKWRVTYDFFPLVDGGGRERWWDGVREGAISSILNYAEFLPLSMGKIIDVEEFRTFDTGNNANVYDSTNYFVDNETEPGRVVLNYNSQWPTDLRNRNSIQVDFHAGYGETKNDVPEDIKTAIKMLVSKYYEDRCATMTEMPIAIKSILSMYKVWSIG